MEARLIQELPARPKIRSDEHYNLVFDAEPADAYMDALETELARERERHRLAVENLRELGLPTRERDELWSAWQYRVKLHRDAIALLAPAPVATGEE